MVNYNNYCPTALHVAGRRMNSRHVCIRTVIISNALAAAATVYIYTIYCSIPGRTGAHFILFSIHLFMYLPWSIVAMPLRVSDFHFPISNLESGPRGIYRLGGRPIMRGVRGIYRQGDRPTMRSVRIYRHLQGGWPTDCAFFHFPISNLESGPRGIYRLGG